MTTDAHIQQLKDKHARLQRSIEQEEQRPMPDGLLISRMKREKLQIKDEIAGLQAN